MKLLFSLLLLGICALSAFAQIPKIEPGVSHELAVWRAARYSDVRYKLNLTLEKMSPVLKGTIEIRVNYVTEVCAECPERMIILDWRKIVGHEQHSTVSNVILNGHAGRVIPLNGIPDKLGEDPSVYYWERYEHLIFRDGVVAGENVIKLDFTSPILASGSAITRFIDKEDGSEYIYSLISASNASTVFPMFNQPDLDAKFSLSLRVPQNWNAVSNEDYFQIDQQRVPPSEAAYDFRVTSSMSPYLFSFAAGDFQNFGYIRRSDVFEARDSDQNVTTVLLRRNQELEGPSIFVRRTQAIKFRSQVPNPSKMYSNRNKYFEYKTDWSKYDLVIIPGLPSEVIQAPGITFVRESSIIGEK
jgi:aminopeptidase N